MNESLATARILEESLKPLSKYYTESKNLEEIAINCPGEVWCKFRQSTHKEGISPKEAPPTGWAVIADREITLPMLERLCAKLANVNHIRFSKQTMPLLSVALPGGHRFQAVMGANVQYHLNDKQGIGCCIRLFSPEKRVTIRDFATQQSGSSSMEPVYVARKTQDSHAIIEDLLTVIGKGQAMLVSGATASGKTSFLNDLISYIPRSKRILTVEDTRELLVPHRNRLHLLVSRTQGLIPITYNDILDLVVRMTPDVLIAGEISVVNAPAVFRLMTTGHTNFMATIHASSPEEAVQSFYQNLLQSGLQIDSAFALKVIRNSFSRIVQIHREGGKRTITEVTMPALNSSYS